MKRIKFTLLIGVLILLVSSTGMAFMSNPYSSMGKSELTVDTLDITSITDGNVPYISATGFADSPLWTDGTYVGVGAVPGSYALDIQATGGAVRISNPGANLFSSILLQDDGMTNTGYLAYSYGSYAAFFTAGITGEALHIGTDANVPLEFGTNNTSRMVITAAGGVDIIGITDGNIPYMSSGAAGFADSPLSTDGTDVELGADDVTKHLDIHSAGTIKIRDDSDDTLVTIGPVADGTTVLGMTGSLSASGNLAGATYGSDSSITDAELLKIDDGAVTEIIVGGGAGSAFNWGTDLPTAITIGTKYIYRADGTDIPVADGGTGASTFALNGVLYGNGTSAIGATAIGAEGSILVAGASPFVPVFSVGTGTGAPVRATSPTIATPVITSIVPGANFSLTQNSVSSFTSEEASAVANTLYLKAGNVGIGTTSPQTLLDQAKFSADALGSWHTFSKSRHATAGSHTIVQDNDVIGGLKAAPSDGTDFGTIAAAIQFEVDDASPAASSIGGAIVFKTAAGVASDDLTERMRIAADGSSDFTGDVTATSFTADPSSAPGINFIDSDGADLDVSGKIYNNLTATGSGAEVGDLYFQVMGGAGTAGTLETFMDYDGSNRALTVQGSLNSAPMTETVTTEADITDPITSSIVLIVGDDDSDNDAIDLQDGTTAGQILYLIASAGVDADDTITINMADTTCTNCPAIVLDAINENAHLIWTGATWAVVSLEDAL